MGEVFTLHVACSVVSALVRSWSSDICNFRALRIKGHEYTSVMVPQNYTVVFELPECFILRKRASHSKGI